MISGRGILRQDGSMAFQIAQDPAADAVLSEYPFALLDHNIP